MKRVLFLTGNIFPCNSGDAIFSAGLVERLAMKHKVEVLGFGDEKRFKNDINYLRIGKKIRNVILLKPLKFNCIFNVCRYLKSLKYGTAMTPYSEELIRVCKMKLKKEYDYVFIDHLRMYYIYEFIKPNINKKNTRVILIEHNIEWINMFEMLKYKTSISKKIRMWIRAKNLKKYEINAINNVDALWLLSKMDLDKLNTILNFQKEYKIVFPYFYYERIKKKEIENSYNLLFLGSMSWYPNVIGIEYFIKRIFPQIILMDSRYKLYVVGNNPHKSLWKYNSNKIVITGSVESVDEYINMCDFMIIPNKLGTGIKIKVLEAILKGIPIMGFKESFVGYPKELINSEFCVNNDEDFAKNIVMLNSKTDLKYKLIDKVRMSIIRKFSELDID